MRIEKRLYLIALAVTASCALALPSRATDLVNDTWLDGTRTDPTSAGTPAYAENNGVTAIDSDSDTNLESAWFKGGGGSLSVTNPGSGNVLEGVTSTSSQHWYTYFTQPSTKVTLANPGDELKLTWVFTPTTIGNQASQALPIALASNPSARVAGDGTLPTGLFSGYSMFLNFSTTLSGSAFALKEWATTASGSLLGTAANWGANGISTGTLTNAGAAGNTGYVSGTQYTFVFDLKLDPAGSGNLIINSTMTGGSLNNSGVLSDTYTDASPNSLSYDIFAVRPANTASTAAIFDTSLFKVEIIPEPSTFMLAGSGLALMICLIRRRRRS
jgi:hypothetical protein